MSKSHQWIFLRGLGRNSVHWGPFVDEFQKCFPKDEVELLDLRGNGNLAHSPSYLSITENIRDLRARSRFIQQGSEVHLMTISLGSMVGVEWARTFPNEIAGLVTINTSDRGTAHFFERLRPANYLRLLKFLSRRDKDHKEIEAEILKTTTNLLPDRDHWAEIFAKSQPTSKVNFSRQLAAAGTYEFPQQKPKTEVLMLVSNGDRLVHPNCSKRIAEMWTLKVHEHPDAGHDLPIDDPHWICEQVRNWQEFEEAQL